MSGKKLVGIDQEIIEAYLSGTSPVVLGERYGTSNVTIYNLLKRNGIQRRSPHEASLKYPYDESFFDTIDSQEKAYFLGLMYADGYNNQSQNYIALTLTDYELVQRFRSVVNSCRPIHEIDAARTSGRMRTQAYELKLYGNRISSALADKGCSQRKSLTLEFPAEDKLPTSLIPAFCRGYFDGDGCIHVRKQGWNKVVHIVGTEKFLTHMAECLPCPSFVRPRHNARVWFLGIYRMDHVTAFRDWLYKQATVFLPRKYDLFFSIQPVNAAA